MLGEKSVSNAMRCSLAGLIFTFLTFHIAYGLAETQIIGGTDAPLGRYPYQVSMKTALDGKHFCGGAILNEQFLITAANCLYRRKASNVLFDFGGIRLNALENRYKANNFIIHPNYTRNSKINDIALVNLTAKISFSENIKPIDLISYDDNFEDVNFIVTGWGKVSSSDQMSERLQQFTVQRVSQKLCSDQYNDITENQICVLKALTVGLCDGDDGSPLTYNSTLVGIMSYGTSPCGSGFPDVFTKMYNYREWINELIKKNDGNDGNGNDNGDDGDGDGDGDGNASSNQQLNIALGLFMTYLGVYSFL